MLSGLRRNDGTFETAVVRLFFGRDSKRFGNFYAQKNMFFFFVSGLYGRLSCRAGFLSRPTSHQLAKGCLRLAARPCVGRTFQSVVRT